MVWMWLPMVPAMLGGPDAITGNLDANARVTVKQGGSSIGTRRSINFIPGNNAS